MFQKLQWTPQMITALNQTTILVRQENNKYDWTLIAEIVSKLTKVPLTNKQCRNRYMNFESKKFQEFKESDKQAYFSLLCEGISDKEIIKQLRLQKVSPNSIKKFKKSKKNTLCKDLGLVYKTQMKRSEIANVIKDPKYHYRIFSLLFQTNQLILHYRRQQPELKLQELINLLREYFETGNNLHQRKETQLSLKNRNQCNQTQTKQDLLNKLRQIKDDIHKILRPMLDVYKRTIRDKENKLIKFKCQSLKKLKYLQYILTQQPQKVREGRDSMVKLLSFDENREVFNLDSGEFHFISIESDNSSYFIAEMESNQI